MRKIVPTILLAAAAASGSAYVHAQPAGTAGSPPAPISPSQGTAIRTGDTGTGSGKSEAGEGVYGVSPSQANTSMSSGGARDACKDVTPGRPDVARRCAQQQQAKVPHP